jgi:hypothetical protein
VIAAIALSAALLVAYLLLGGASYKPMSVGDPCHPSAFPKTSGTTQLAEQLGLAAADGAACKLHVSREALVIALGSPGGLDAFASEHGITSSKVDDALRSGLATAVDEAQKAGNINVLEAFVLRETLGRLPIARLIDAFRTGSFSIG